VWKLGAGKKTAKKRHPLPSSLLARTWGSGPEGGSKKTRLQEREVIKKEKRETFIQVAAKALLVLTV